MRKRWWAVPGSLVFCACGAFAQTGALPRVVPVPHLVVGGQPAAREAVLTDVRDVGLGTDAQIFVVDADGFVRVFDSTGVFVRVFGGPGTGAGRLNGPVSLDVSDTSVVVRDMHPPRLESFTLDVKWIVLGDAGAREVRAASLGRKGAKVSDTEIDIEKRRIAAPITSVGSSDGAMRPFDIRKASLVHVPTQRSAATRALRDDAGGVWFGDARDNIWTVFPAAGEPFEVVFPGDFESRAVRANRMYGFVPADHAVGRPTRIAVYRLPITS
jgi:hypothetical protein